MVNMNIYTLNVRLFMPGVIAQIHPCELSDEVDGTNHKTSHDGMFKVGNSKD